MFYVNLKLWISSACDLIQSEAEKLAEHRREEWQEEEQRLEQKFAELQKENLDLSRQVSSHQQQHKKYRRLLHSTPVPSK